MLAIKSHDEEPKAPREHAYTDGGSILRILGHASSLASLLALVLALAFSCDTLVHLQCSFWRRQARSFEATRLQVLSCFFAITDNVYLDFLCSKAADL